MKKKKKKHTIFIRYQATNDIEGTRCLNRLQQWYIDVAISRYGSNGTTNTDLRKYLRRDLLGHNPPDTDDRRCWVVYDSTQVLTLPAAAPAPTERRSTRRAPAVAVPAPAPTPTVVPAQTVASYSKSEFQRTLEMIQRHVYCYLRVSLPAFLTTIVKQTSPDGLQTKSTKRGPT